MSKLFLQNIANSNYKKEITAYCNEQYSAIGDRQITENDLINEASVTTVAINFSEITQALNGFIYPEISFYGDCKCGSEHGICIGFRNKKFLGIKSQDWTL